jgi:carbon-monoxide dehydrogenase medium subunit
MIPANFDYVRPATVDEAVQLLAQHGDDAKLLAGGHSLIPAMKLRLAQPKTVVDISRVADLAYIREAGAHVAIGAMATHHDIETSALLKERCPLMCKVAAVIGDVQVRNRGTLAGSLVHADPAADWPAAILALDAEMVIAGPNGRRTVKSDKFFVDLMQTAVQPGELLVEVRVPFTGRPAAYVKTAQKASGFAIAGVAVVVDTVTKTVRVGLTGVAAKPCRAKAVERYLKGKDLTPEFCAKAGLRASKDVEALNDIHASAEFRLHLACVNTRRSLELAISRV